MPRVTPTPNGKNQATISLIIHKASTHTLNYTASLTGLDGPYSPPLLPRLHKEIF